MRTCVSRKAVGEEILEKEVLPLFENSERNGVEGTYVFRLRVHISGRVEECMHIFETTYEIFEIEIHLRSRKQFCD